MHQDPPELKVRWERRESKGLEATRGLRETGEIQETVVLSADQDPQDQLAPRETE